MQTLSEFDGWLRFFLLLRVTLSSPESTFAIMGFLSFPGSLSTDFLSRRSLDYSVYSVLSALIDEVKWKRFIRGINCWHDCRAFRRREIVSTWYCQWCFGKLISLVVWSRDRQSWCVHIRTNFLTCSSINHILGNWTASERIFCFKSS